MADLPKGFILNSELESNPIIEQPTQDQLPPVPEGFIRQSELPTPQVGQKADYISSLQGITAKRQAEVSQTFEDYSKGNIGLGSALLQTVGKGGFGTAMDYLGQTVSSGLSALTPDIIEDPIKQFAGEMIGKALNTETAKKISAEWGKLDPETQKNLESTGNIMSVILPKVKIGSAGEKLKDIGSAIKRERLSKTLKLPETPANKIEEAKRLFADPIGYQDMVDEVSKIKSVSPNKSPKANIIVLGKELDKTDRELFRELRHYTDVDPDLINNTVDKHLKQLMDENSWLQTDGAIASAFDTNLKTVYEVLDRYPNTPAGVLRARREFDKIINNKSKDIRVPESELIARDAVSRVLRRSLNDIVEQSAPRADVAGTLKKMSSIYKAIDNLSQSHSKYSSSIEAVKGFAKAHPYIAYGTATGAGAGAALASPAALGTGLAAATGIGAYRALPSTLQGVGSGLGVFGKTETGLPLLRAGALYGNSEDTQQ